jgi:hypothetical protein
MSETFREPRLLKHLLAEMGKMNHKLTESVVGVTGLDLIASSQKRPAVSRREQTRLSGRNVRASTVCRGNVDCVPQLPGYCQAAP